MKKYAWFAVGDRKDSVDSRHNGDMALCADPVRLLRAPRPAADKGRRYRFPKVWNDAECFARADGA